MAAIVNYQISAVLDAANQQIHDFETHEGDPDPAKCSSCQAVEEAKALRIAYDETYHLLSAADDLRRALIGAANYIRGHSRMGNSFVAAGHMKRIEELIERTRVVRTDRAPPTCRSKRGTTRPL